MREIDEAGAMETIFIEVDLIDLLDIITHTHIMRQIYYNVKHKRHVTSIRHKLFYN